MGRWCETGVTGASWGELGGVGGLLDRCCSCLGGFVEYTMCSEERIRMTSHNGISRAVDGLCVSFTACWQVSGVVGTS